MLNQPTHNECESSMEATTVIQRLEQKAIWNERIAKTYEQSCPPTSKAFARDAADLREAIEALKGSFRRSDKLTTQDELDVLQAHCEYLNNEVRYCMNIINDGTYPQVGECGGFYGKLAAKSNVDRDQYKKRAEYAEELADKYKLALVKISLVTNQNGPDRASGQYMAETANNLSKLALSNKPVTF